MKLLILVEKDGEVWKAVIGDPDLVPKIIYFMGIGKTPQEALSVLFTNYLKYRKENGVI